MVLVVSLMILLVMTVIGVTAMQSTSLEERMAGNIRDHNIAFQAAESAVRDAENFIGGLTTTTAFDGTGGLYGTTDTTPDPLDQTTWSGDVRAYADTPLPEVRTQPRYFVRHVGEIRGSGGSMNMSGYGKFRGMGDVATFEITARGTGGKDSSRVVLRSYFGRLGL